MHDSTFWEHGHEFTRRARSDLTLPLTSCILCRALAPIDDKNGRGLLSLILGLWDCMPDSAMHNALCVLAALVAAVPAERRYILAPIATSGWHRHQAHESKDI